MYRTRTGLAWLALLLAPTAANSFEAPSGSPEEAAILSLVNDQAVDAVTLDVDGRLIRTAAYNLIGVRDGGPDGDVETLGDNVFRAFTSADDVLSVSGVGPSSLERLYDYAVQMGYDDVDEDGVVTEAIFSPQDYPNSHLARVTEMIKSAEHTLDIAMYSYSDAAIAEAIEQAVADGVQVRFIFDTAQASDRKLHDQARESSKSGRLEQMGVDVRYVNKVMHHKFVMVDGPVHDCDRASTARIASGSANWSYSAATNYDENTLFLQGHPEIAQAMQAEFDLMWEHSRDFSLDETIEPNEPPAESTWSTCDATPVDQDNVDFWVTSPNFDISDGSTTFRADYDRSTMRDQWVDAINAADDSIWIASGHLRTPEIAQALIDKKAAEPNMDIRVYLDGQEYRSSDSDKLFGYALAHNDVDVRFKFYAYKWDYTYALQMHHKLMIIDGDELYTGSYNLSPNAEWKTFENTMVFRGAEFSELITAYVNDHQTLWDTDRDLYDDLMDEVSNGDTVPLVFDAMALTWQQVKDLKSNIYSNCPTAQSDHWYTGANGYSCTREGTP